MYRLNNNRYEVIYNAGETIHKQGSSATHVITLTSGLAKLYLEGKHRDIILEILKPTDFFAAPGIFVDNRHHYTIKAITPTTACFLDVEHFREMINKNPYFAQKYIEMMNEKTINSFGKILELTQKQMPGRVAGAILYLSNTIYESKNMDMELSRQDIADLCGLSKESTIRILKDFKDAEYISLEGKHLTIKDHESLQQIYNNG
ncbi:MAG: Crp/Fnr family transcriptional regulator [Bacteroidales bacterium]|nr:Crp/Fnr family transcriptional regulator [Bacteroidales bacterium]MCF8338268.1 Crp/Fnr family transcriptional regulator [Bacteroidales bacterium]